MTEVVSTAPATEEAATEPMSLGQKIASLPGWVLGGAVFGVAAAAGGVAYWLTSRYSFAPNTPDDMKDAIVQGWELVEKAFNEVDKKHREGEWDQIKDFVEEHMAFIGYDIATNQPELETEDLMGIYTFARQRGMSPRLIRNLCEPGVKHMHRAKAKLVAAAREAAAKEQQQKAVDAAANKA